jgi:hypothetical protein
VLLAEGRVDEAEKEFGTALRLRPNFDAAKRNLDAARARAREGMSVVE